MRFALYLALGAIALAGPAGVARAQLVNPSFENGLTGWNVYNGTVGLDVDVYTQGGGNPIAPDGTSYAGIMSGGTTEAPVIWQKYTVQNHVPGQNVNYSLELYFACWANDTSGDPNSQVQVTIGWENDGIWEEGVDNPAGPTRVCDVFVASHKATSNDNDDDRFRYAKVTGTLPDDPQEIIVRIAFRHNVGGGQVNATLADQIIFTAESGPAPALPSTNLLTNGDFETGPYNITYNAYTADEPFPVPTGWSFGGDGRGDDGPGEGFTNGTTSPTNPLGVTTTDGTHFYGVAKPDTVGTQPKMTIYQIVPVTGAEPCATGFSYEIHYESHNSVSPAPDWWDHSGTEVRIKWMNDGSEPPPPGSGGGGSHIWSNNHTDRWFAPPWSHVRFTNNDQTGFTPVDVTGQIDTVDVDGNPMPVYHVIIEFRVNTWRPPSDGYNYRALVDNIHFNVEAVVPAELRFVSQSDDPPAADCETPYSYQLLACGDGNLVFSLVSGQGIMPPGLTLSSDGLISGQSTSPGTFQFTVEVEDGSAAPPIQRQFTIVSGGNCCGAIAADFDDDGDVDADDFAFLQLCFTGQNGGILLPPGIDCSCADLDKDQLDVDQTDLTYFELCASGPGIPAEIGCADQACCMGDGVTCIEAHPVDCLAQSGRPMGIWSDCGSVTCPWYSGCCLPEGGGCALMWSDECEALGGAPQDPGVDCTESCLEACCYSNGFCVDLYTYDQCVNQFHQTAMGPGTTCAEVTCP